MLVGKKKLSQILWEHFLQDFNVNLGKHESFEENA